MRSAPPGLLREMVGRIVERFNPQRVILFGSYARGTATKDSDVDVVVVFPRIRGRRADKAVEIRLALRGLGVPKDVLVKTASELDAERSVPGTLGRIVLQEGKVLYERGRA